MARPIILASTSEIRRKLLRNAGVRFEADSPRLDEESIKAALLAEGASPREIADALAEGKAKKLSLKQLDAVVIGSDQVLDLNGTVFSKPNSKDDAMAQLQSLRAKRHSLLSAVVVCHEGKPIWRFVGQVRLYMRDVSDAYLEVYVERNWESIRHSVGAYKLEEEGVRLFSRIEGDYFTVLGLPIVELLSYLSSSGDLET